PPAAKNRRHGNRTSPRPRAKPLRGVDYMAVQRNDVAGLQGFEAAGDVFAEGQEAELPEATDIHETQVAQRRIEGPGSRGRNPRRKSAARPWRRPSSPDLLATRTMNQRLVLPKPPSSGSRVNSRQTSPVPPGQRAGRDGTSPARRPVCFLLG